MKRMMIISPVSMLALCLLGFRFAAAGETWGRLFGHKSTDAGTCCEAPTAQTEVACKACKPVPDKKKATKVVYECTIEWYCQPKCPCPLHMLPTAHGGCDASGSRCTSCEVPRCRRVLVKKFVTTESPTTKCVVETVSEKGNDTPAR